MDVLIVVGDQDSFHESDREIVSSPIWLADILTEEGLIGTFLLQARRAEILAEQGRHDVIAALRRHEIGLHGRDLHPVVPEIVEGLGWAAGVEALDAVEGADLALLGKIFDVAPVASSTHRNYTAPQLFGLAHKLRLPYLFGPPAAAPALSLSWYAGALNVPFNSPVPDFLGFFPAVFDDVLADDEAFLALLERLRRHVERSLAAGLPLLVVFTCHPERLCYSGPIEQWLYGNGVNHGRAAVPPGVEVQRSRADVSRALTNFRTLVRYLRDSPDLEPITVGETVRRYGQQALTIGRDELAAIAEQSRAERQIAMGVTCSAGEALLGFASSLRTLSVDGRIPMLVERQDCLGPIDSPPLATELIESKTITGWGPEVALSDVNALASALLDVAATGTLPAAVVIDRRRIGLGTAFGILAEAYALANVGQLIETTIVPITSWPRYPEVAGRLAEAQRLCEEDPLVRPGLSTEAAALQARLQSWTLKPAIRT